MYVAPNAPASLAAQAAAISAGDVSYADLLDGIERVLDGQEYSYRDELRLSIEEDGVSLYTVWRGASDNSVLFSEHYGARKTFAVAVGPAVLDLDGLRRDLGAGGDLAVLIKRIHDGLSTDYDRDANLRGTLTEDAEDAVSDLDYALDDHRYVLDSWGFWDETDWVSPNARCDITAETTDKEIAAYLKQVRAEAPGERVILSGDATEYLIALRDELREEA